MTILVDEHIWKTFLAFTYENGSFFLETFYLEYDRSSYTKQKNDALIGHKYTLSHFYYNGLSRYACK